MKTGQYLSAATYLSAYRVSCERKGCPLDQQLERLLKDAQRSCDRGRGAPRQALPLPFNRLGSLPRGRDAWATDGPLSPRNAIVLGSWFLCREVELSCLRASLVELSWNDGLKSVTVKLPASKTDPAAAGVSRTRICSCPDDGPVSTACPVHVAWDQILFLRRQFPRMMFGNDFEADLPFFPTSEAGVCTKEGMAKTFKHATVLLQVPGASVDGSSEISGH